MCLDRVSLSFVVWCVGSVLCTLCVVGGVCAACVEFSCVQCVTMLYAKARFAANTFCL